MSTSTGRYGSDVAVETLEQLGVTCATLNPGASFRGLHESLVHRGSIRLVLCLSEGVVVAAAHGYGKAANRPMAAFLHNLVGLQNGSLGLFNAWIDQSPLLAIGGSGPADRTLRRPYIDWIHTVHPQAGIVRDYLKWDDEPTSIRAIPESLERAHQIAMTAPLGPTYVAIDAELQESEAGDVKVGGRASTEPSRITIPPVDLEWVASLLNEAERPVIIADYVGRTRAAYDSLVDLAERTRARVIDLGGRHSFPNTHPADGTQQKSTVLQNSDLVLALDVRDLTWALSEVDVARRSSRSLIPTTTTVVSIGFGELLHRGFLDREGRRPGARTFVGDTEVVLPQLADLVVDRSTVRASSDDSPQPQRQLSTPSLDPNGPISLDAVASVSGQALSRGPWQLAHGLLKGAVRRHWDLSDYNCHLGGSGGGGLGYGPGATIGAALASLDDRVIVALQPDGDFLYTATALWTMARESLPVLMLMINNRTYGQDRMHQETMSRVRDRPIEHAAIGIDIDDPAIDYATLARAQGVEGWGPVATVLEFETVFEQAIKVVRAERRPVLIDVLVQ